jgi:HD-like signal output (HDOD) protein
MGFFDFFKRKKTDPESQLRELLEGYELPSFPAAVVKTLEMLRDPEAPLKEISRNIEADPGMHVSVLKAVNSAAHGLSRKVGNIRHAITLLGRARLESIILPIAVRNSVPDGNMACLDQGLFWKTSAQRACIARIIARHLDPMVQMESFTAGLLQDMAIPVLIHVKEREYCTTIESWNVDQGVHLHELERQHFGFDHQAIGALMAEKWGFPDYLLEAILYHHSGSNGSGVARAVGAVSQLRYSSGDPDGAKDENMLGILQEMLGVEREDALQITSQAYEEAEDFSALFAHAT